MEMGTIKTMSIAIKQFRKDRMFTASRGEIELEHGRQRNCSALTELKNRFVEGSIDISPLRGLLGEKLYGQSL